MSQAKPAAATPAAQEIGALRKFKSIERQLTFEENQGRSDSKARFVSRGPGYELLLSPNAAEVSLSKTVATSDASGQRATRFDHAETLHLTLQGANPKAGISGEDKLAAKSNYYIGNDRSKWREGVPNYSRVRYSGIYPGIDLVYYGNQRRLEHDFVVAPGADPKQIHIGLSGAKSVHIDGNGDLVMEVADGSLRLLNPVIYQDIGGKRKTVSGHYQLAADNSVRFELGRYDKRHALVIDPVLSYSTYLGGSNADEALGVVVSGNVAYIAGTTTSTDFPGAGGPPPCCTNGFVAAIDLASGGLVYSTYLSATINGYQGSPMALDGSGNLYITGSATASLPTTSTGLSSTFKGGSSDAFVAELSSTGTLLQSGFLGGSGNDFANGIAFDPQSSHVLVTGGTSSTDFPISGLLVPLETGQLYVTPDGGTTWNVTSGSGSLKLGAMDVDAMLIVPGSLAPTTYYVGGSGGVYKSTDGANWTSLNAGLSGSVLSLAYDSSAHQLYAGTTTGLYKYPSAQNTWYGLDNYTGQVYSNFVSVLINPTSPSTVYVADAFTGVAVTTDGGTTWTHANSSLPTCCWNSLAMSSSGTLYAFNSTTSTSSSSFYTSSDGINWTATASMGLPSGPYDFKFATANSIFVDNITGKIYLTTEILDSTTQLPKPRNFVSSDGGNSWTELGSLGSFYGNNINVIIPGPSGSNLIYAGTDDGLYQSSNSGQTWTRIDTGFTTRSVQMLTIDAGATASTGKTVLYAGSRAGQGFITTLDTSLNPLFSTPLGGAGIAPCWYGCYSTDTQGASITADTAGNIYASIATFSDASHLPGSSSGFAKTPFGDHDGYLLKLSSGGSPLWGTFLGGSGFDDATGVAVSPDGGVVVSGQVLSTDFATTAGAYASSCQTPCTGSPYVAKFNAAGARQFATYVPGLNGQPRFALDGSGNIYLAGNYSNHTQLGPGGFPLANPLANPAYGLANGGQAGISELDPTGSSLLFSTLLGSATNGYSTGATAVTTDASGAVYLAGYTTAPDFPLAGSPVQSSLNNGSTANPGAEDAFLVQISHTGQTNDIAITQFSPATVNAQVGDTVTFDFTIQNLTATGNGANNVVLETDLPLTGVSLQGAECSVGTPSHCYIGLLAPGQSISGSATTAYASVGTFKNVFTVRTDDDDPVSSNNTAVVTATIQAAQPPDLQVTVTPSTQSADIGGAATFTVNVVNNGLGAATGINLHSTLSVYSGGPFFSNAGSQWFQLMPSGTAPAARDSMSTVYDPTTNSMIMFGGYVDNLSTESNDVWVLSNANGNGLPTWTQLSPTGIAPEPRFGNTAIYDAASNRMIIFGGYSDFTSQEYNDVWALTNANGQGGTPQWIQLSPSGTPPSARDSAESIYDPATHTMTVFGGYVGTPGCGTAADVWILTNADGTTGTPNWTGLNPSGTSPSGQAYGTAVYDPATNRMILFGGHGGNSDSCGDSSDVTILTNANGQGGTPTWISPALGSESLPSARDGHVAGYDPTNNTMIITGGAADETWQLFNANAVSGNPAWNQLQPVADAGQFGSSAATYDPVSHAMTVFGGSNNDNGDTNEVWILKGASSSCSFSSYIADATCSLGNLAPGQSTTLGLQALINTASIGDTITFTTTATEDQSDTNTSDNSGSATVTISNPDLGISLTGPTSPIFHGDAFPDSFNYTLTVTNNGDNNSGTPTVLVQLDPGLTYAGQGCVQSGQQLMCLMGPLTPGTNETTTISVSANAVGTFTSSAAFYHDGNGNPYSDTNPLNDSSGPVQTTIALAADLELSLSTSYYSTVGAPLTLNADVYNGGPSDASNVTVTFTLPPQLSVGFGAKCSGTTGTVTCTVGQIPFGGDGIANIPIVANYPGVYTILATAQDAGTQNPNPMDASTTLTFTAIPQLTAPSESFVASMTDQGQVAAYYFGSQYPYISKSGASPGSSVIDPSGRYMYVNVGGFAAYTSVVDFSVQDEVSRIHGVHGRPMALTPDGTRLISAVASLKTDALAVVDTTTQQIVKTISLDGMFGDATGVADLVFSSGVIAHNKLYFQVSTQTGSAHSTAVLDLTSYTVKAVAGGAVNLPFTPYEHTIAAKADGTAIYALRSSPPEILVIDTNTDAVTGTVSLSQFEAPTAIAVTRNSNDPQGQFAYIAGDTGDGGAIFAFSFTSNEWLEETAVPSFLPNDLVLSSDGTVLEAFHLGSPNGRTNAAFYYAPNLYYDGNSEFTIGNYLGGVSTGFLYTNNNEAPSNGNPSLAYISDVQPGSIDNSTPNTLSILGSGFTADSKVKIGHLDPMPATFLSSSRLDVTLPALVPEQDAKVIVTLPNLQEILTGRNVSTAWASQDYPYGPMKFGITSTFTLPNALGILGYGDSNLDLVSTAKKGKNIGTLALPNSLAFATDGQTAYVSAAAQMTGVQAISLATGQPIANIPVQNDYVGYQDALATGIDPVDGKPVLYFNSGDNQQTSNQLSIVNADATDVEGFNSVKRTIDADDFTYSQSSGALAASPSGRYVYSFADVYDENGFERTDLIAYDAKNGTAAVVHGVYSSWGAEQVVPNHLRVSPDGDWLVMPGADGSVKAVNIGADPSLATTPTQVITFADGTHSFKTFQVAGSRLFAFDATTNTITAFNFLPGTSNFTKLGSVTLPGPGSYYESPLTVDPTGNYAYVALKDQDAIAILDANKVAASDPTALLDEGGDDRGIEAIAIQPSLNQQVNVSASFSTASYTFIAGQQIEIFGTVANSSTFDAHNVVVTITPPTGVSFSNVIPNYNDSTCRFSTGVATCTIPILAGQDSASFDIVVAQTSQTSLNFSIAVMSTQETNASQTPSGSTMVTINPGAALSLSSDFANYGTAQLVAGTTSDYSFLIGNLGPNASTGGVLYVYSAGLNPLPDMGNISYSSSTGVTCDTDSGYALRCTFTALAPNSSYLVSISGVVPNSQTTLLEATLEGNNDPMYSEYIYTSFPVYSSASSTQDTFLVPDAYLGTLQGISPSDLTKFATASGGINPVAALALPGGRTAFVGSQNANYISVLDLGSKQEIYRIQNEVARAAALTTDSSQLLVVRRTDPTKLDVFDTTTFALVNTITLTGMTSPPENIFVASGKAFLLTKDAAPIYVVNLSNGTTSALANTQTYGKGSSTRFGLSPDGGTLVALGGGDANTPATVFLINPTNNTVIQSTPLPANTPNLTVAVTPITGTSTYAYITADANLSLMDISVADPKYGTFVQGASATLGMTPTSSAITSDGQTLGFVQSAPGLSQNIESIPTASVFNGGTIFGGYAGQYPGIISDSQADFLPSANAPQISSITPYTVVNNTSNDIQINGSNFTSDALVKIGSANPVVPTNASSTQLTVTLPPFTPSGYISVIVINRNAQDPSIANRNIPSAPYTLYVFDGPGFNQNYDSFTLNVGNSSVLANGSSQSALGGSFSNQINVPSPAAIVASTSDNWFVASSALPAGFVTQGSSYYSSQNTMLAGNAAARDDLALVADPTSGRDVVLVPSTYPPTMGSYDWQLNVVDADPYSPTYDTVLRWIAAGTTDSAPTTSSAFAATPDGKFAYQQVALNNGTSDLVIYDLTNNVATIKTGIGIDPVVHEMQVSPDGKYLAVANPTSYDIQIFSITNKTSPSLVDTIAVSNPNGATLTNCCNLRIVNNVLYVYDPGTMLVQAFSFQPPSFAPVGSLQLTGSPDYFFQGGMAVTPDGANLYVAELNNDVIDVIDTAQFGSGDINQALLTRISSQGVGPASIALNGTSSSQAFADLTVALSHSPDPAALGGTLTYTISATNLGPDQSGNVIVTDNLPSGFTFSSYNFDTGDVTCSGTTVVTCALGSLSANQTSNVYLTVSTAGVSAVGQYSNTVSVGQSGQVVPDPMTGNNTATDIANLADPDLAITASADNLSPAVGGTVHFTVGVVNNGQVPSTNTTISGSITGGTITNAGECTTTATTFSCVAGEVDANGGTAGLIVTATMPATAGSVAFNASVSEKETDANTQDNTLTPPITISVGGGADIVLVPAGSPVSVNGLPTYTVVVTNNGPDAAQDVTLKDTLSGFGFVSAVSSVGSCSFNGAVVNCPLGNLAVGASVTVNVSVTAPGSGWASNEFQATSDTFDPLPTNNLVNMGPFGGSIGNTAAGPNVLVDALDSGSGMAANFLFSNVTKPGLTKVTSAAGTQPPAGYRFGTPALIYDLSTSASYSGLIRVALRLSGLSFHHPNAIHLFHFENGTWVDRTMALDTAHGMITGMTSSLSPFAIVEPLNSVPIANAGTDQVIPGASTTGASVTLNGVASTDADGDPLTYTWTGPFPEGNGTVTGVNPKVTLPLGVSKVMLVVNDGETASTPAALNVTVSDFLIAAPSTAITLARGQSTSFNVVLTPKFGAFNDPVTVACGNVPAGLTCAVKDTSVTPGAQGASVTVTLTASASAGLRNNSGPLFAFWMGGLPVFGVLLTGKFKRDRRGILILLAIMLLMIVGMVACGGAGSNAVTQPPPPSSTSTSVTLTGTSGDLQHSSTATITLQ